MRQSFALVALSATLLGGCENLPPPPNRSPADPSQASAPEASVRRFRPNLVATTQIYLDPSAGQGAQKMDHSKMQGMEGMDHSKMPGMNMNKQEAGAPPQKPGQMQDMDHSKMPGMESKQPASAPSAPPGDMQGMDHSKMPGMEQKNQPAAPPADKAAVAGEMKKTADEMKKLSDEMKAKSDAAKGAEKPAGSPAAVYTCPMHPEIGQPNPGKCPKCGMTLVKEEKK